MIDNIDLLNNLTSKYGDGFYLVSENRITHIYNAFIESFKSNYSNCIVAYSFKTCSIRPLLEILYKLGAWAEVTSEYEYTLAKDVGFKNNQIVYNGPYKNIDLAIKIAQDGGIVNIDSKDEAIRFCDALNGIPAMVGIRINANIDGRPSRFGINIHSKDMEDVINLFIQKNISIKGFMCHIKAKTLEYWDIKAKTTIDFVVNSIQKWKLKDIRFIDFGGGYKYNESMFDCYSNLLANQMNRLENNDIQLILEPGAAICEGTMDYYAKVVNTNVVDGVKYVTVSATINDISAIRKKVPGNVAYLIHNQLKTNENYNKEMIVGFTCLEDDIILDYVDKNLNVGDYVVFSNVGAYSSSLRPVFIRELPAILFENVKGELTIKRYLEADNCLYGE